MQDEKLDELMQACLNTETYGPESMEAFHDYLYEQCYGYGVVEGPIKFAHPLHPYTKALLSAIPSIDIHNRKKRIILQGEIVSPVEPKPGCRFAARCPYATEKCYEPQQLREVSPEHFVSCCRVEEINS